MRSLLIKERVFLFGEFALSKYQYLYKNTIYIYDVFWVEYMMSLVISFEYFTHFSNLNISGTNAGICKR